MDKRKLIRALMLTALVLAVAAAAASVICVYTAGSLTMSLKDSSAGHGLSLCAETDDDTDPSLIMTWALTEDTITLRPVSRGQVAFLDGDEIAVLAECLPGGVIVDLKSGNFSGWQRVVAIGTVFMTLLALLSVAVTVLQLRLELYSYRSPMTIACSLFLLACMAFLHHFAPKSDVQVMLVVLIGWLQAMLLITFPVMLLFTAAMLVSNIALLRHEGTTWRNLLGSMIGMAFSLALLALLMNSDFTGSERAYLYHTAFLDFLSGILIWSECKLAGIIVCGLLAAHSEPARDKDYVLILGCKLSSRGGLTPLLRGRVDQALRFREEQVKETGKVPVLVPCGGQGPDEKTSEAQAMRAYLLEKGIPEGQIVCEDRSANTWQNIRNAQALMAPGTRAAFSTTRYHVFRSGVWAHRNGLMAEGMGSRTRWYYWPNAFMREYVALLKADLRREVLVTLVVAVLPALLVLLFV